MAEIIERGEFRELLKELSGLKAASFVRSEELGAAFNFLDAVAPLEALFALYRDLAQSDLDFIPDAVIKNHLALGREVKKLLEAIQQFNPKQANATVARDQIIERVRQIYDGQWQRISPTLAYCSGKQKDLDAIRTQMAATEKEFQKAIATAHESLRTSDERAQKVLRGIEDAAAKAGVDKHAIQFSEQSEEHRYNAYYWMGATVLLAAIGAGVLHYIFIGQARPKALDAEEIKTGLLVFEVITRLMVFSFFSFGMYWAARNYAAHRHNYVVNRHRQNALATFNAFVSAAGNDEGTKNAVLLQASQAIYAPQSSGYIDSGGTGGPQATSIFEFVKSATGKGD